MSFFENYVQVIVKGVNHVEDFVVTVDSVVPLGVDVLVVGEVLIVLLVFY